MGLFEWNCYLVFTMNDEWRGAVVGGWRGRLLGGAARDCVLHFGSAPLAVGPCAGFALFSTSEFSLAERLAHVQLKWPKVGSQAEGAQGDKKFSHTVKLARFSVRGVARSGHKRLRRKELGIPVEAMSLLAT